MAVLEAPTSSPSRPAVWDDAPEPYTHEEFAALTASYPDLRMELTREGRLIMMPPSGGESSYRSSTVSGLLFIWSRQDGTGMTFDANGGFVLPNGATRSPDASWLLRSRWDALTREQRQKFLPVCPDFVVEVLSPTDSLPETREKMQEWIDNGARLGWLINSRRKQVEIYRPGQEPQVLDSPLTLSGEDVLPDFMLDLKEIWE